MKRTKQFKAVVGMIPFAWLLSLGAVAEDLDLPVFLQKASPTIAEVKAIDATGAEVGKGTGLLIGSEGVFIASRRLLTKGVTATVQWDAGEALPIRGVLIDDVEHDLVVAKVDIKGMVPLAFGVGTTFANGQPLVVVGFLENGEKSALQTKISSICELLPDQDRWIQLTLPVPPNLRCAPVFTAEGELVGVAISNIKKEDFLPRSFLIPAEVLKEHLQKLTTTTPLQPLNSLPKTPGNSVYLDPDYIDALLAASAKDREGQLKSAQLVVDHFPTSGRAQRVLGLAYKAKGLNKEALEVLRKAAQFSPKDAGVLCDLAEMLALTGNAGEALITYGLAVKSNPNHATLWYNFAWALDDAKKAEEAVKAYQQAVRLNPGNADAWFNLGMACYKLKKWNDAQQSFQHYTSAMPTDPQGWVCLGLSHQSLDKNEDALKAYQHALEIKSDLPTAWLKLGEVNGAAGNQEEAIRCYQMVNKLDPANSLAWLNLAQIYGKLAKADEAVKAYQQYLKLKPDSTLALHNMIPYLFSLTRYTDTITACEQATRLNSNDADAWMYHGQANQKLKQNDEAIKNYQRALAIRPDFGETWNNLGILYLTLRKNDDALKAFLKAVESEPNNGEAWLNLGLTYLRKDNRDKAKEVLGKLQAVEPKLAEQLEAAIQKIVPE